MAWHAQRSHHAPAPLPGLWSPAVGNVKNTGPELVEPIGATIEGTGLV